MTPELWERLKPLFHAALDRPREERSLFLAEACLENSELRQELAGLLHAHEQRIWSPDGSLISIDNLFPAAVQTFAPGEVVLGRFRIARLLGSGGMGDVYEAADLELAQPIALKTIRSDITDKAEILARFKKEVQLARRVSGSHVCRIHELFVVPENTRISHRAFLTMELLEGITLADRLRQSGPIPWREAQTIAMDICAGLTAIHGAGIIHRDLKTRNIMLAEREGSKLAVLMDFGLARELTSGATADGSGFTIPGAIVGTPEYMAPEQFEGHGVSPATDVYSLGVVLYELVTGQHPFAASTPAAAAVRRGKRPQPASSIQPGLPHRWDAVIGKCLEYEAARRYPSANDVAEALTRHPLSARRLVEDRQVIFRRRGILAAVFLLLLLMTVPGILWYRSHRYYPPSADVQKWYEIGTTALHEGTYLQASLALQVAVDRDPSFALGHARLADAWSELDFASRAQREMLLASAPASQRNLPKLDRMYIEAVRATLTRDFSGAVDQYRAIFSLLPESEKVYGYYDLGRAAEKAGLFSEALKSYAAAARLDKDNPAAQVHLGVVYVGLQNWAAGEAAFQEAETLYRNKGLTEGEAEIAYQRGYAANLRGDTEPALRFLRQAHDTARDCHNIQLQIRALTQMSSVEYSTRRPEPAIQHANEAIQLARANGLEYWLCDGLIRLGNTYLSSHQLDNAEPPLQEALNMAEQNQQPRLEANARMALASLRSEQRKWDESMRLAQMAQKYYQSVGMVSEATDACVLFIRGEQGKQEFGAALQDARKLLDSTQSLGNAVLTAVAEESMGSALDSVERYPEALSHYKEARRAAATTHDENEAYYAVDCANILQKLGWYGESEEPLAFATGSNIPELVPWVHLTQAGISLNRKEFQAAISLAGSTLGNPPKEATDTLPAFRLIRARAEAELGRTRESLGDLNHLFTKEKGSMDDEDFANAKLIQAESYRREGLAQQAAPLAEAAVLYFSTPYKKESRWQALLELARVYRSAGRLRESRNLAREALDILHELEHAWPPGDYQQYSARPDVMAARQELSILAGN